MIWPESCFLTEHFGSINVDGMIYMDKVEVGGGDLRPLHSMYVFDSNTDFPNFSNFKLQYVPVALKRTILYECFKTSVTT